MTTEDGEQTGEERPPLTREDVLRLIEENGGTAEGLDLSGRNLNGSDLSGLILSGINLQGAHLGRVHLRGAYLERADLRGAHLGGADLQGAQLWRADLQGARLWSADLQGVNLWGANLQGAYLHSARLYGGTSLQNVRWGDHRVGEERGKWWDGAMDVYRALKAWHLDRGIYDLAAAFSFRERECARKGAPWFRRVWKVPVPNMGKLWLCGYGLLAGHGERPQNVVVFGLVALLGLAAAYLLLGSFEREPSVLDAVYYSVVSFTSLGYGEWAPKPVGWARYVGAAESLVGGFTIALFLVTFTRKMMR